MKVTDMESIVVEIVTIIQRGEVASESTDYSSDKKYVFCKQQSWEKGFLLCLWAMDL